MDLSRPFEIKSDEPCKEILDKFFIYDRNTGQLINRITRAPNCIAGSPAGSITSDGYLQVGLLYKNYRVHRLCFCMLHGYYPAHVEHINRVKTDNRPSNLRAANYSENNCNRCVQSNNRSSGLKGISKLDVSGYTYWDARITFKGKTIRRRFPYSWEGLQKAYNFVKFTRSKLHKEFACD